MKDFPEYQMVRDLIAHPHPLLKVFELTHIDVENDRYPLIGLSIGSQDPEAPVLGVFGGVHGLEKIGTHVACVFLKRFLQQLEWDKDLANLMQEARVIAIPLVNPGGMSRNNRCNPQGVDLMRNAPVECEPGMKPAPLVSGHRVGNWLPWYRGVEGAPMEKEAEALIKFVQDQSFRSKTVITIDIHSGFGMRDRLWFPYSKTSVPFPGHGQVQKLKDLLDNTIPHHVYKIEPQHASYFIQGDLWDYLYDLHQSGPAKEGKTFIPWALEMGSWAWVKKNPLQLLTAGGLFNPLKAHRYERTMRRHLLLLDFLLRAARNPTPWA